MHNPELAKAIENLKKELIKELPKILRYMACIWIGMVIMLLAFLLDKGALK